MQTFNASTQKPLTGLVLPYLDENRITTVKELRKSLFTRLETVSLSKSWMTLGQNMMSECPWLGEMAFKSEDQFSISQKPNTPNDNIKVMLKMESSKFSSLCCQLFI